MAEFPKLVKSGNLGTGIPGTALYVKQTLATLSSHFQLTHQRGSPIDSGCVAVIDIKQALQIAFHGTFFRIRVA